MPSILWLRWPVSESCELHRTELGRDLASAALKVIAELAQPNATALGIEVPNSIQLLADEVFLQLQGG